MRVKEQGALLNFNEENYWLHVGALPKNPGIFSKSGVICYLVSWTRGLEAFAGTVCYLPLLKKTSQRFRTLSVVDSARVTFKTWSEGPPMARALGGLEKASVFTRSRLVALWNQG